MDAITCQVCKTNQASVHLKEIRDNLVSEVHLCRSCFQQRSDQEVAAEQPAGSLHLAVSLDQASDFREQQEAAGRAGLACPECGLAFRDFLEIGRLGCATCYKAFGEELRPYLLKIHGATTHTGKAPQQETKSLDLRTRLSKLQADLDKAVVAEDYERAAALRDEIRAFERHELAEHSDA